MRPRRTLLLGLGQIGAGYASDVRMAGHFRYATHAQAILDHPAFDLVSAVDPSAVARSAFLARWPAVPVEASLERVTPDAVDVLVLALSPEHRSGLLERFPSVRAVVIEKPLGVTDEEAAEFADSCRRRGVLLQVNIPRRADETMRTLAGGDLIARIGKPQAACAVYGNGLLNNGTHMIDLVRMLLGEVDSVRALGQAYQAGPLKDDAQFPFVLTLEGNLAVAFHPLRFEHYRENALDIWGECGRLAIMQEGLTVMQWPRVQNRSMEREFEIASDRPMPLAVTLGDALFRLYDNLAAALAGTDRLCSDGVNALQTSRVVTALLDSARRGGQLLAVGAGSRVPIG